MTVWPTMSSVAHHASSPVVLLGLSTMTIDAPAEFPDRLLITRLEVLNWIAFGKMINTNLVGWEESVGYAERVPHAKRAIRTLFEAIAANKLKLEAAPTGIPGYETVENPGWGRIPAFDHVRDDELLFGVTKYPQWFRRDAVLALWPPTSPSSRKRSENVRHDWQPVRELLLKRFAEDGVPDWSRERGRLAEYERWVEEKFHSDRAPTSSQLRTFIKNVEKEHFAYLDRRK